MYSADNGKMTDFHLVHLGSMALRGAALTIIEATAVQPRGRISPGDSGLWEDAQIAPMKRVVDFVHGQGQKIGIQLAHAGRKASTLPPWEAEKIVGRGHAVVCPNEQGGWTDDVWAPSDQPYGQGCPEKVHAMTEAEIKQTIQDFASSAKRALAAGIDVIEIHGAHGYLLSSFLSPISNTRTDKYGGADFDNRIRMLLETCIAVREVIPKDMPMFVRVSATEWVGERGWDVPDTIKLAKILAQPEYGVDLLDVSSGGNSIDQKINMHNGFQVGIAGKIRASLHDEGLTGLAIGAVGLITAAKQAGDIVQIPTPPNEIDQGAACVSEKKSPLEIETEYGDTTQADVVLVARQFLKEPEWVLRVAHQLGVEVVWPVQYARARWSRNVTIGTETRL